MYIDPSAGGMIFQVMAILFGVLSGGVLLFSSKIKMSAAKLRRHLRERKRGDESTGDYKSDSSEVE